MISLKSIFNSVLSVMYPENLKCVGCSKELDSNINDFCLCEKCYSKVKHITGKVCLKCGEPLNSEAKYCLRCKAKTFNFVRAYSYCSYKGIVKKLIKDLKFNNKAYLSKMFAHMLYVTYLLEIMPAYKIDIVTYVPIHTSRLKERKYNQCELIAYEFCKKSKLKLYKNVLIKIKQTKHQVGLSNSERKTNLKNAFKVTDKSAVRDKTVLLIDDIFTTGSTCDECAQMLMRAGAYRVVVLTVAHTELNKPFIKKVRKKWKLSHLFQTKRYVTHT